MSIKKLILSKFNDANLPVQLGTLQFDESNHGTLTIDGSGAAAEKLKQDWNEVSSKPELTWKMSVPDVVDGRTIMRIKGSTVHPGEDTYPEAVLNTLERSYGYSVEIGN